MAKTVQNTRDFKTVYKRTYQMRRFRQSLYQLFCYTDFRDVLNGGEQVEWSYDADMLARNLGSDDSYKIRRQTTGKDLITIDQKPSTSFIIPKTERIQDHLPTQQKWATKAVNVILTKQDGDVLAAIAAGAGTRLDASYFGGVAGNPVALTDSNVAKVFAKARVGLLNRNVIWSENKMFKNDIKQDHDGNLFAAAAISPEMEAELNLAIGFKDTGSADNVLKEGFNAAFSRLFKFNTGISTSLPFEFRLTLTQTPTNSATALQVGSGSTTVGTGDSIKVTWVTSIGSTPGNVLAETSAAVSVGHLVDLLNAPYAGVATKSVPFVEDDMSIEQLRILDNLSAVDNEDGSCVITLKGHSKRAVSQSDANGTIDRQAVLHIFATSESCAFVTQAQPELLETPGELVPTGARSGVVGKHFVAYSLHGRKVTTTMADQIVVIPIDASSMGLTKTTL
jgi:hypothetical protein